MSQAHHLELNVKKCYETSNRNLYITANSSLIAVSLN